MDTKKMLRKLDAAIEQLEAMRKELSQVGPKVPPSIAIEEQKGICHFCKEPLGDEKPVRGVHQKCNQRMTRAKKDGEITDLELMEAGKIGPPKASGRKKMSLDDYTTQQAAIDAADASAAQAQQKPQRKGGKKS